MSPGFATTQATSSCKEGEVAVASLGYSKLECNCTIGYIEGEPSSTVYEFRSEPRIWGIEEGGPADGRLREGDFVTAIDGYLITTAEGGNRFGDLTAGEPVALTVRRDGRKVDVTITPVAECKAERAVVGRPDLPPVPPKAWTVKPAPRVLYVRPDTVMVTEEPVYVGVKILPAPVPDHAILPRGWLGFSLSCSDCIVGKSEEGRVWWKFSDYPEINRVEIGSPAHEAGMRAGDVLTHIDDHDLTEEKGGELFGALQPGDTVTFRYVRQGEERTVTLMAGEREIGLAEPLLPPPEQSPQPDVQRFSGVVGDAFVEVTGGPIVVNRTGDELVISSKDITVRIRRAGGEGAR
jgi:hypothetical protein